MVLERFSGAAGRGAGGFLGGLFNNPGVVIIAGIGIALFLFRDKISDAFGSLGESIGNIGNIEFPDISFPEITFPEITFPSFPDITFPEFNFNLPSLPGLPGGPAPFVEPERQDVPFPDPARPEEFGPIDIVPGFGRDDPRREFLTPAQEFAIDERGSTLEELFPDQPVNIMDFINRFVGPTQPSDLVSIQEPEIPFAVANIEETQSEFQERSAAFAESFPDITRSTSLPGGDIIFGEQLSRNQEDFQRILDEEAARSESIFAALFGNVQNPNF